MRTATGKNKLPHLGEETEVMKVSKWLEGIYSHAIHDQKLLAKSFKEKTGLDACWPTHSAGNVNSQVGQFKGPEAEIKVDDHELMAYGWEIAEALADKFANDPDPLWHKLMGRGSRFDAAKEALEKAGK